MSADTDSRLLTEQIAAWSTGETREVAAKGLQSDDHRSLYLDAMEYHCPDLYVDFAAGPSLAGISDRCIALTEAWGETPQLIVLDTATDIQKEGDDYSGWKTLWLQLREMSRYFDSTIISAHHVKDGLARDGKMPPRQSDGKYGADEFAEIVLGLHKEGYGDGNLSLTVLKNRGGKNDVRVHFQAEYDRATVEEI